MKYIIPELSGLWVVVHSMIGLEVMAQDLVWILKPDGSGGEILS